VEESEIILPPPNEAHAHKWELAWKHPEAGRAAWKCTECQEMQWSDKGSVTVGPVAPWVTEDHLKAFEGSKT
jgi:hypothetical protein